MFFAAGVFLGQIKRPKVKMEVGRSGGGSPVMEGRRIFEQKKGGGDGEVFQLMLYIILRKNEGCFLYFSAKIRKKIRISNGGS